MSTRAIIILAGGRSFRLGHDKALIRFEGTPFVKHILDRLRPLGDEFLVSIGAKSKIEDFLSVLPNDTIIVQDNANFEGPLAGFSSALQVCKSTVCFLVACDMPFVDPQVVELLFKQSDKAGSAVPRWNDGRIEPLHAVYERDAARHGVSGAIREQSLSMIGLVAHTPNVHFVSVENEIKLIDPALKTFSNFNTPRDFASLNVDLSSGHE
jgi:molybdopterin-guanine dinucleotide biosynthesis protein A